MFRRICCSTMEKSGSIYTFLWSSSQIWQQPLSLIVWSQLVFLSLFKHLTAVRRSSLPLSAVLSTWAQCKRWGGRLNFSSCQYYHPDQTSSPRAFVAWKYRDKQWLLLPSVPVFSSEHKCKNVVFVAPKVPTWCEVWSTVAHTQWMRSEFDRNGCLALFHTCYQEMKISILVRLAPPRTNLQSQSVL